MDVEVIGDEIRKEIEDGEELNRAYEHGETASDGEYEAWRSSAMPRVFGPRVARDDQRILSDMERRDSAEGVGELFSCVGIPSTSIEGHRIATRQASAPVVRKPRSRTFDGGTTTHHSAHVRTPSWKPMVVNPRASPFIPRAISLRATSSSSSNRRSFNSTKADLRRDISKDSLLDTPTIPEADMKVRPTLRPGAGGAPGFVVINAKVGEKLATSGEPLMEHRNSKRKVDGVLPEDNNSMAMSELTNGMNGDHAERNDTPTSENDVDGDVEAFRCGFLSWRPDCLQIFNNPKAYLVFLCLLGLLQNMTVLGYLNVVITTLERRFRLTSVRSGIIVIAYDISNLIVCAFVTYFGERGRKPLWVGVGSILFSIGSVVFALPHFLSESYQYGIAQDEICPALSNATSAACEDVTSSQDDSMLLFYWLFIVGQVLHGWGGSTLYTLGVTYMDESLPSSTFSLYMGIFSAMNAVGPAIGYIVGGAMLSGLYTDILQTSSSSLDITPANPVWIGAWWLGFIINGIIIFVITIFYLGFPNRLPVSRKLMEEKKGESQAGCEFESREGSLTTALQDFPRALGKLLRNAPFVCISCMATTEWFVFAGLTSFSPKFFESQFNISAGDASYDIGIISVLAGIVGSILSGILMKRLDMSVRGMLKLSLACAFVSLASQFVFIFHCPDVPLAGVTVPYGRSGNINATNLTATCHSNCACPLTFDPVCGDDNVLYYSPCHAGCSIMNTTSDGTVQYSECSCIPSISASASPEVLTPSTTLHGNAERGRCAQGCGHRWVFYIIMFISFLSTSMLIVPAWTATIRCVAQSLRGFALGLQTVMYGALGTVPGPVVFGLLIDRSCLLWESECDGSRSCWLYDNQMFSHSFLLITVIFKALTVIFCMGALCTYRSADSSGDIEGGNEDENENGGSGGIEKTRRQKWTPFAERFRKKVSLRLTPKSNGWPYPIDT